MKKFMIFILFLFLINVCFGATNVSVRIDNYGWITISSDNNISEKVNNLNHIDIYQYKSENGYKYKLKLPLDKEHKQFIYNLSPIGNFKLNKVESAKFLKIDNYYVKNGVVYVQYSYNYLAVFLVILGVITIILGFKYYYNYLNKLFDTPAKSIKEKSKILKKYTTSMFIYSLYIAVIGILLMIFADAPLIISYVLNIPLSLSLILYFLILFNTIFLPVILHSKKIIRVFSKKEEISNKKDDKKLQLTFTFLLLYLFAPLVLILSMVLFEGDKINKLINFLPIPLKILFWIILGYGIELLFLKATKPLLKILKISDEHIDKETLNKIKNIVNELSKELNTKPFKKINIIKSGHANAIVDGLFKEKLVLTSKLLEILNEDELKAVIAHELAHKKRFHIKIGFVGFILIGIVIYSIAFYLLRIININGPEIFIAILCMAYILDYSINTYLSRKIEKDADLLATKIINPKVYIKALAKIHFVSYELKEGILNIFSTHPSLDRRIKYIQKEYNISDEEVKKILEEAYKEIEGE